jgi:hypothetical protein
MGCVGGAGHCSDSGPTWLGGGDERYQGTNQHQHFIVTAMAIYIIYIYIYIYIYIFILNDRKTETTITTAATSTIGDDVLCCIHWYAAEVEIQLEQSQ